MVELALTTPLFLLLIVGAVELGRVAYYSIEVENAARAGASYGSLNAENAGDTTDIQYAAKNDAPDLPNLTVSSSTSCVCEKVTYSSDGSTTESYNPTSGPVSCSVTAPTCTEDDATATQYNIRFVNVSTHATISPIFNFPGLPSSYTLNGSSQLRTLEH